MGSLYGPGLGRGCWVAIGLMVAFLGAGAFVVFRLAVPGTPSSADLPPAAAKYQRVAEATLHRCDPSGDSATYARCAGAFGTALHTVDIPASAKADLET